jgi:hypothetical protein
VACAAALLVVLWLSDPCLAQTAKEIKTKPGVSVIVVQLINPRADCSANPGPAVLPSLREKPTNGVVQMQIVVADVAASGNCPARKIPAIALIYTPRKDFTGSDSLEIEVDTDNRVTLLSYKITVVAPAEPL